MSSAELPTQDDRRGELVALWRTLAVRGAAVTWHDLAVLPDDVVDALCAAEARRIRALVEGEASGWMPGWRPTTPPELARPIRADLAITGR